MKIDNQLKEGEMFKRWFIVSLLSVFILISGITYAAVPMVGDRAPDFTLTSVKGEKVTLSQYRGSVVVLGLFHICEPCMNQATEMQRLLNEGKSGATFIGVNTDGDTKEAILTYLGEFQTRITFPYLIDPGQTVNKMYIQRFMPTVIIIDGDGVIRYRGSTTPKEVLLTEIRKVTAK